MRRRAALHFLCLALIGVPARADWVMGRVVAITDGDTLTILLSIPYNIACGSLASTRRRNASRLGR
jgi:hypothetical protein